MERMILDLWTCDVGAAAATPRDFSESVVSRVERSWDSGADVVLFPEFTWMGLERFVTGPDKLGGVSSLFWDHLWPDILTRLSRLEKAVVLGTAPFATGTGKFKNRAPVISGGRPLYQDKIHLTPWESDFSGDDSVGTWKFRDRTLAVVICLDVEIPEISSALRGSGLDLMLVPSATESVLGVERVGRCADARAVELGCHVAVSHLTGRAESVLVDENTGQLAAFSPSQSPFSKLDRRSPGEIFTGGFHRRRVELDMNALDQARTLREETNPIHVTPERVSVRPR